MYLNENSIISEIHGKVHQLITGKAPEKNVIQNYQIYDEKRLLRKIPERNYSKLTEYAPIGWL